MWLIGSRGLFPSLALWHRGAFILQKIKDEISAVYARTPPVFLSVLPVIGVFAVFAQIVLVQKLLLHRL